VALGTAVNRREGSWKPGRGRYRGKGIQREWRFFWEPYRVNASRGGRKKDTKGDASTKGEKSSDIRVEAILRGGGDGLRGNSSEGRHQGGEGGIRRRFETSAKVAR